jgi:hypothetical protein
MALNPVVLKDGFTRLILAKSSSAAESAQKLAATYLQYASAATALWMGAPVPPICAGADGAMANVIAAGLLSPEVGNPAKAATAIANGVAAFWLTATFPGAVPPSKAIFVPAGLAASLQVALQLGMTEDVAAAQLASCFDSATRTAMVIFPSPLGPPLPPVPLV